MGVKNIIIAITYCLTVSDTLTDKTKNEKYSKYSN